MKLIPDFKITPFSRTAWVSGAAKQTWEKAIQDCAALVSELEIESVAAGQRPCSWQTIARAGLPDFARRCAEKGLIVLPVRFVGAFNGFVHYTPEGDASTYNIIARRLEDALRFREAFEKGDHEIQGEMLGFPKCCREAFAANWKAGYFDPIWQSACEQNELTANKSTSIYNMPFNETIRCFILDAHPFSNPLLRYIGLRVGFHIPHSFNCKETIAAGIERLKLAKDQGLVKILESLLSMPMRAELFHGILTVRTPIFYLIQYTVPTEEKYTIEVSGDFLPKEGTWPGQEKR